MENALWNYGKCAVNISHSMYYKGKVFFTCMLNSVYCSGEVYFTFSLPLFPKVAPFDLSL